MPCVPGMYGDIKLIAGTSAPELAQEISEYLGVPLSERDIYKFDNDNTFCRLGQSVRGQDVYIIQTTSRPVNDNLMELLITLDTVRRDSAGRTTAVVPYMCYTRSDKKDLPRVPISARLVADMIQVAGADRYITIDLHAGQIQGFFSIPGDVLSAWHMLSDYFVGKQIPNLVVISADLGYAKRGRNWASKLDTPLAFVEKRHTSEGTKALTMIGDVDKKNVLIVDDEVDTAGTLCEAIEIVKKNGAEDIYVAFTHPTFSPPALERLAKAPAKEIVFTNTIPVAPEDRLPNMKMLSIAPLLGEVILRAHEGRSVGELFNE
jgi:ribose-phosphate pyrophosphokinase